MKKTHRNATLFIAITFISLSLTACGNNSATADEALPSSQTAVKEQAEEVKQPEAEVEVEPTEEVVVEETTPEEPQVEMVDFETWAKQEDNDEVCLVVWNEELGIQEIIPTTSQSGKVYEIQEGDRFAIPYRENIVFMGIRDKSRWSWENQEYYEITLPKGEISIVDISYDDENGEGITLTYSFK